LYAAKEQAGIQQSLPSSVRGTTMSSWLLPLGFVGAMLAGFAVVGLRRRRERSTRQIQVVEPVRQAVDDFEPLLPEELVVE